MQKISIMLVDDHQLFREGLRLLLGNFDYVEKISEASNGEECLLLLKEQSPEVVFMDVDMPVLNGVDASKKALALYPQLNIIALSMYSDEEYYSSMIDSGVKGFILKNSGIQEVENAMLKVLSGKNYFSQEILSSILKGISRKKNILQNIDLSEREIEILYQICKGWSNQEIADNLYISKRTVDKHRENILSKTNSKNTAGLVMYAIKNKIVEV
ncbi:MAG: response regulator [Prolixibacteraceae bacterium]